MDKLYTVKEVTEHFKMSRATLYVLMKKGIIKATKIGGKTLFTESELQRVIKVGQAKKSEPKP